MTRKTENDLQEWGVLIGGLRETGNYRTFNRFRMEKALRKNVDWVASAYLLVSILSCVIGQLFLKHGVENMNSFSGAIPLPSDLAGMLNFSVVVVYYCMSQARYSGFLHFREWT